jgi:peroxiredoxin
MSIGLERGATFPDYVLPDETGAPHRLSDLQGSDVMVVLLGRGEHCPRERQHQRELLKFYEWAAVAFTQVVTILPNDLHDVYKLKISTGARWTFLADREYEVQRAHAIDEYTDRHHQATVPHTLLLAPGRQIDKVYVGYWFWGRPTPYQLWEDLGDLLRRSRPDFDPTRPDVRGAWEATDGNGGGTTSPPPRTTKGTKR